MLEELTIDKLIILLPTIVAAMVGYIYWLRKNRYQKFIDDLKESLEYIISPIYHDLRYINTIKIPEIKEKEISLFFSKYSDSDTNIFKISRLFLLNWFYDMEKLFYIFQSSRYEDDWKLFYYKFEEFYKMIENEYFEACSIQFVEHRWTRDLNSSNIWIRLYKEIIKFSYDLFKALVIILLLFFYFIITLRFTKDIDLSFLAKYKEAISYISVSIVMMFGLLTILNSGYLSIYRMNKRDGRISSFVKKFFEKRLPKIYSYWEGSLNKKLVKYQNYPKMYEKKDITSTISKKNL